jgi:dienelactone hydrolase
MMVDYFEINYNHMKKIIKLILILFGCSHIIYGQTRISEKDLRVLNEPADTMMRVYLTKITDRQFAVRDSLLSTFTSVSDWNDRAQTIRDSMVSWTGPLPERTPLNARVTGRIDRDNYTIEKILFESRPDYLISANLYLPKNFIGPRPAHLNVIGHAKIGKADERYQRMSIALVRKGFVVLTIDQLGQGERQVEEYSTWGGAPGNAHQITGIKAFICGTHVFNIMVWDAIRAVDYLVSRPEVDPEKISMTGSSGGGMMTTYILPFDNRISVAVPTCNPNTWSYRVHANLATDHEQVFFGALESSIDPRGDPLFAQAPKPLLLNTTTDDNLNPPRGVWDLNTWLYKSYSSHGVPEKVSASMVRAGHAYNKEQREITYSWILRWTGNDPADFREEDASLENEEDLWAAKGGSVFNESGSRRDHDLILDYYKENKADLVKINSAEAVIKHKAEMAGLVKEVLNSNFKEINVKCDYKPERKIGDIIIKPFILEPEPGILLPGVLLSNSNDIHGTDVILYVNEKGKSSLSEDMEVIKDFINRGKCICAIDLRGIGETSPDMAEKFWDFLAGKPVFGQRVMDILSAVKWLKGSDVNAGSIKLWGKGMCALYGAFAGVLSDDISGFVLEEPLISFKSVIDVDIPSYNHEILLPGILEKFDMAQAYQTLALNDIAVINPRLGDKTLAAEDDIRTNNELVSTTYQNVKGKRHSLFQKPDENARIKVILNILK